MGDKKITSYPKEKVNILFLENISDAAVKRFAQAGYTSVRKLGKALSEDELVTKSAIFTCWESVRRPKSPKKC